MQYIKIFDRGRLSSTSTSGVVIPNGLTQMKRLYQYNKDSIESYYNDRTFAVKNTHLLSRITELLPLLLNDDQLTFSGMLQARTPYISKNFNLTSSIHKGEVHGPVFYGNGGAEILISLNRPLMLNQVRKNWKHVSCLEVYQHPRNDTRLLLPFGQDNGERGGLSVIGVDLNILGVKYREFMREQQWNANNDMTPLGINQFISKYVITGFLEKDIDLRMFNRVMDKFYDRPIVNPKFKHRFMIYEPENLIEKYVDGVLDRITTSKLSFEGIIMNIPLIFNLGIYDILDMSDIVTTRQVKWATIAARLKTLCFIYDVAKERSMGRDHISDWKYMIRRFKRDGGFFVNIPEPYKSELEEYMYKIENM